MLGPTGVGVLWVRKSVLETMNPFHGGGDMIREVHKFETTGMIYHTNLKQELQTLPMRLDGAAIDYLSKIGRYKSENTK